MLAVCTLAAVVVFGRVGNRRAVLVMARTVEVGQTLDVADLRAVKVSLDPGLRSVPAALRRLVVGRPAAVRLVAGSLLSPAQVGAGARVPDGSALVGAVLKAGQFPSGLVVGDTATLVILSADGGTTTVSSTTPTSGATPTTTPSSLLTATVIGLDRSADSMGTTAVSLQVPLSAAPTIAAAGAAGRLDLVVVGR